MSWHFWICGKTVQKFAELPIYSQQQKYSPGILVSSKVRSMWIFAGVREIGVSNESGVVVNGDFCFFRSLYLLNLNIQFQRHSHYIVLCSPSLALHWHRNGWPSMTVNGHFALKSRSSSESNGLAFWLSENTVEKIAELRIYCLWQQKYSPATVLVISVMKLFTGVTRRGNVKPVNCIFTFTVPTSHTCCSLMSVV